MTLPNYIFQPLPMVILLVGALLIMLLVTLWRKINSELLLTLVIILFGGFVFASWQGWLNPAGIFQMFVFDRLSLISFILFGLSAALALIGSLNYIQDRKLPWGDYLILILFSVFGGCLMATGNNLMVVFIGLETLSLPAYVLAGYNKKDMASHEASIKYFLLGSVASAIVLFGMAFYYGAYGSLDLSVPLSGNEIARPLSLLATALIFAGFSFKIAAVPFQWWTPDVYQGSPLPVTTFFATTIKAAAFVAVFRVLGLGLESNEHLNTAIVVIAVATMSFGNLSALLQDDVKRMLAYSSIAHAGYMLLAFVFVKSATASAQASLLFYLLSYTLMTTGAFLVLTLISSNGSFEKTHISIFAGLSKKSPWLALTMTVFLLSLIGMPPTAGFFSKFYLFKSALWQGHTTLVIIAVINSLVSVYYYMRPIVTMYFGTHEPSSVPITSRNYSVIGVIIFCAISVVLLGIFPAMILSVLEK